MRVKDAVELPGARFLFGNADAELSGVATDTRDPDIRGKLYVALKGERSDGHAFLEKAVSGGVTAILIEPRGAELAKALRRDGCPAAVVVPDTLAAMGELARRYRSRLPVKIIAITGSNGKTSAKEFARDILATTYETVAAERSFNNSIGVPLTIFRMKNSTQVGVLELGMNHPGELDHLTRIADPDAVAITSIGPAHLGFFKTVRRVARAKSEILTASRPGIPAILPADSEFLPFLKSRARKKHVSTFGSAAASDWRLTNVESQIRTMTFGIQKKGARPSKFRCPNFGDHQLNNMVLAIGLAQMFAVPEKKIRAAVSKLALPQGRGEIIRAGKHLVVNDSYNANPVSMAAALWRIDSMKRAAPGYDVCLVLGDMLELGSQSAAFHAELGNQARLLNPKKFIFVGSQGAAVGRGFAKSGKSSRCLSIYNRAADALDFLKETLAASRKMLVLFKASHSTGLELMVKEIVNTLNHRSNS